MNWRDCREVVDVDTTEQEDQEDKKSEKPVQSNGPVTNTNDENVL